MGQHLAVNQDRVLVGVELEVLPEQAAMLAKLCRGTVPKKYLARPPIWAESPELSGDESEPEFDDLTTGLGHPSCEIVTQDRSVRGLLHSRQCTLSMYGKELGDIAQHLADGRGAAEERPQRAEYRKVLFL